MDEASLTSSLDLYKAQLCQVEQALQAAGDNRDLLQLRSDLQEVVNLTTESILALKKSQILKSLDDNHDDSTQNASASSSKDLDDEYAAFQELMADDVTKNSNESPSSSNSGIEIDKGGNKSYLETTKGDNAGNTDEDDYSAYFKDLIGGICRVPFSHDWGSMSYYNAIITGVDKPTAEEDSPKVIVMFCNPTHNSMMPCKYFLEGQCRFPNDKCRFSHGYSVCLDDLKEFKDPDYSNLKLEDKCLARYEDDLWYKAIIVDLHEKDENDHVTVLYDMYKETAKVDLKDIFPFDNHTQDENSDEDRAQPLSESETEEDELPVFLWRPSSNSEIIGEWEAHTKGIGMKLMKKMGYIYGQGLGRFGEGRVEPVPIQLIPQGKSLDTIMELKELAGDRDMFDVLKQHKKGKKKRQITKYSKSGLKPKKAPTDVFEFINKKLCGKKGDLKELIPDHHVHVNHISKSTKPATEISEKDLTTRSDRSLNVQLFKTHEEMKNVEKEICKLKQSLSRNEAKDKGMANVIKQKISSKEQYLQKLKLSEETMQRHQTKRTNHKKLTVF